MIAQSKRLKIAKTVKFLVLVIFVIVFFLPIVSMVVTSLKTRGELYIVPPVVWPQMG